MIKNLLLYLLYGALSAVFLSGRTLGDFFFMKWIAVVAMYLIAKYGLSKKVALNMLVIAGIVQSVLVLAQQVGYYRVGNEAYEITGFFSNPGHMGCFQAISFVAVFSLLIIEWNGRTVVRLLYLTTVFLIGYSVIISGSRAGMLACVVGVSVLAWPKIKGPLRQNSIVKVFGFLLTVLLLVGLFCYRPNSAKSRLLIWRVTADMIIDKPLFGFGVGQFDDNYQLYQAEYFKNHPDSNYVMVADNAGYAYNEFLQILAEQGLVGGILILLLSFSLFIKSDKYVKSLLASLLVFSMFTYPSKVNGLFVLFPILFGIADNNKEQMKDLQRKFFCTFLIVIVSLICVEDFKFYKRLKEVTLNSYTEPEQTLNFYTENFDRIKNYMDYNIFFSSLLERNAAEIEEEIIRTIIPTSESWCNIGDYYKKLGEYDKAVGYYKAASYMVPTRVIPNYKIWRHYIEKGERHNADEYAKKILTQPIKVENTVTLSIKREVMNSDGYIGKYIGQDGCMF